jgi:hypothetical protein
METAHVICDNDGVDSVVIGDEVYALSIQNRLQEAGISVAKSLTGQSEEDYLEQHYWHIHTVRLFKQAE